MQQLEIEVLYNLRCESAATMFDLRDVVTYIAKRVGFMSGRVWFGAGNAINAMLLKPAGGFIALLFHLDVEQRDGFAEP